VKKATHKRTKAQKKNKGSEIPKSDEENVAK